MYKWKHNLLPRLYQNSFQLNTNTNKYKALSTNKYKLSTNKYDTRSTY